MTDYRIAGIDGLQLHHLYRAMAWLGEEIAPAACWRAGKGPRPFAGPPLTRLQKRREIAGIHALQANGFCARRRRQKVDWARDQKEAQETPPTRPRHPFPPAFLA